MCGNPLCDVFMSNSCGMENGEGHSKPQMHAESALEILKRRYANDEITKEEFEEKKIVIA